MSKEYSETLGENIRYLEVLGKNIRYKKEYIGNDTYRLYIKKNEIELLENYLIELEQIKNAKPSEALKCLEHTGEQWVEQGLNDDVVQYKETQSYREIKQALLNKSKKEKAFEEIQSIMDTWQTSRIMDNESALREIDKVICEVLK